MEASPPLNLIQAEEVCEYTFKVELIEKDKLLLVVFNTTTGIKYQTYIEEYSDIWESLKINFQHNFPLCFKMLTKALIDKDPSFTVNVLHKIDVDAASTDSKAIAYNASKGGMMIDVAKDHVTMISGDNLETIKKRLSGWQLESFNESYEYKIKNGMSLFKKNLKNE